MEDPGDRYEGARQIGYTIISITVSLLAVFIPILLMGGIIAEAGFLQTLRALTRELGIVLIFDEILSGFRTGPGWQFYTGRFEGSFARGLPFQENPRTGDCRISGTCASLAGLEKALREEGEAEIDLALRRILLIHSIILAIGGIPLIYLGDEIGMLNDYGYRTDPGKAADSRWVHRPAADEDRMAARRQPETIAGRLFSALHRLIALRQQTPALAGAEMTVIDAGNPHVLAFVRHHQGERVLVLANFSESGQTVAANIVRTHGLAYEFVDLVANRPLSLGAELVLEPYGFVWLAPR